MKEFHFSLENVLSYRLQIEEAKKREFAMAHQATFAQLLALQDFYVLESKGKVELRAIESKPRDLRLEDILAQRRYLGSIAQKIVHARGLVQKRAQEEEVARRAYVQARKDRRLLERLRERRRGDYDYEVGREERKEMDEVASRRPESSVLAFRMREVESMSS